MLPQNYYGGIMQYKQSIKILSLLTLTGALLACGTENTPKKAQTEKIPVRANLAGSDESTQVASIDGHYQIEKRECQKLAVEWGDMVKSPSFVFQGNEATLNLKERTRDTTYHYTVSYLDSKKLKVESDATKPSTCTSSVDSIPCQPTLTDGKHSLGEVRYRSVLTMQFSNDPFCKAHGYGSIHSKIHFVKQESGVPTTNLNGIWKSSAYLCGGVLVKKGPLSKKPTLKIEDGKATFIIEDAYNREAYSYAIKNQSDKVILISKGPKGPVCTQVKDGARCAPSVQDYDKLSKAKFELSLSLQVLDDPFCEKAGVKGFSTLKLLPIIVRD
jgi:hypothetical protein